MTKEELEARADELECIYEYRKGVDQIQKAFRILLDNHLNIFRQ